MGIQVGIRKAKSFKILLLASCMIMAHHAAWAEGTLPPEQVATAQDQYPAMPLPDVEFDGSVLQQLSAAKAGAPALAPVKLTPPALNRSALPPAGRLTALVPDVSVATPSPAPVQPVIIKTPAPLPKPALQAAAIQPAPVPARKPEIIRPENIEAETVAEAPQVIPAAAARQEIAAAPLRDLPPEPQIMPMAASVVAATEQSGAVLFPITSRAKTKGELNPSVAPTAPAPAVTDRKTAQALAASMAPTPAEEPEQQEGNWRQENPEIILSEVPYPKRRPAKGMASESFVREARKNLVETYTIMKREGDKMPALKQARVTNEKLPAPRLSVADIAGDPLASQLVDMSPEDVARALNAMAPASGREQAHLARELSAVAKPRIVRQEGEWIRKSGKSARKESDPSLIKKTGESAKPLAELASLPEEAVKDPVPPAGPVMLVYKEGEISLPEDAATLIEQDILGSMKRSPHTRVRIMAYAAASDGKETTARRLSLARALEVRSYLMSQGIDATRLDVRAMGIQPDRAAIADKVDMILVPKAETGKKG